MQYVDVVVGGQYGSEAKGHVTAQLVKQALGTAEGVDGGVVLWNVRVAGPNAGHTVYDAKGQKFAFRSLPVGAVVDERVKLYIAPGSEVDLDVLYAEIQQAEEAGHDLHGRLFVSRQATVIEQAHKDREQGDGLVGRVGSTGKGIGAARADRIMRTAQTLGQMWGDDDGTFWQWAEPEDLYAHDRHVHEGHQYVIIEGTQGYGLSLRASGHYPQVTSSDARAVDFLAMAGIDPTRCGMEITNWVVARVFPIRVAGNSGPMQGETSWEALGLAEEHTTVTQKVRRVGAWDVDLVARAVQANGGHRAKVIITMLDQAVPELVEFSKRYDAGSEDLEQMQDPALLKALEWLDEHASVEKIGAHVAGITFSPTQIVWTSHAQEREPQVDRPVEVPAEALEQAVQEAVKEIFGGSN